jgi:hypothetical protein
VDFKVLSGPLSTPSPSRAPNLPDIEEFIVSQNSLTALAVEVNYIHHPNAWCACIKFAIRGNEGVFLGYVDRSDTKISSWKELMVFDLLELPSATVFTDHFSHLISEAIEALSDDVERSKA